MSVQWWWLSFANVSLQGYKSMNHPTDYQEAFVSVTITEVV